MLSDSEINKLAKEFEKECCEECEDYYICSFDIEYNIRQALQENNNRTLDEVFMERHQEYWNAYEKWARNN